MFWQIFGGSERVPIFNNQFIKSCHPRVPSVINNLQSAKACIYFTLLVLKTAREPKKNDQSCCPENSVGIFFFLNSRGGMRGKAEPSRAEVIAGDGAREGRGME